MYTDLKVEAIFIRFLVDSGAEISILPDTLEVVTMKAEFRRT